MGFENIWEHNGLGIAATGMIIVFLALTGISIFIRVLPGILDALPITVSYEPEQQPASAKPGSDDDEVVAAIAFVRHHLEHESSSR